MTNIYENRLIAFIDVLGFSKKLENVDIDKLQELHDKYSEFIDQAQTATFFESSGDKMGRTNFEFSQFLFDSIVLVSNPTDDVFNVNNFVSAVSLLLELGFKHNLPLRGAISLGNFLYDNERNIFLSPSFPDLVKCEQQQEWVGCTVLRDAEEIVLGAALGKVNVHEAPQVRNQLIHSYKVPLKKDSEEKYLVLNFMFFMSEKEILLGIKDLIEPKKSNTNSYFEYLKSLKIELTPLDPSFLPAVMFTSINTRSGTRLKFLDSSGKQCQPGVDNFTITATGKWYE